MNASTSPSRSASQAKFAAPSRTPSFVEVNHSSDSKAATPPPGLSFQTSYSRQITAHLELRLLATRLTSRDRRPLTPRDLAILLALDQYRYLDRHQLQALFFAGPRSCQYRLEWLVRQGLVRTWRVTMRPGFVRRASIYFLSPHGARALAESRDENPLAYVQRADHALSRHYHLVHDLQASQFFVDLATACRQLPDQGLYHWVGEQGVRRGYAEEEERGPIADGWGRFLTADREVLLHLEWDRGSELAKRLRLKLGAYISYFVDRTSASQNQVLVVAPTDPREEQHSAGSGKSNTIAWAAHRLSTLHDAQDRKVFDKVVIITDRVILDRQLQDTVYQFEHARGVVTPVLEHSQQLAEALIGEQARIIITTLQKFPFVLEKVAGMPARRYAVIVDEAHSSQTGEAAKDLRVALGATEEQEMTAAEAEDAGLVAAPEDPVEEALAKATAARGKQKNLSFFAFTATPKQRTLEMFGTWNADEKKYEPFHLYSMRQAIEEAFIMDVLANYTTYQTFWRIEKAVAEDPVYETAKARRAIARFVSLHPYNLAQKAEVIVEHCRGHTMAKIGGRAKAMVVTSSRLHAVRYKQAIDKYVRAKGYTDIVTLVAFSGKVIADDGEFTEPGMNKFPESQTAERFGGDDYQVLIVAEKFQTGFDQPLLHTMYVDKVLLRLAAVQTLSRLNRIHPLKSDTFVLDFRNDAEEIQRAFEPYYGKTVAAPTDPNVLWDTRRRLDAFDVLRPEEVKAAVALLLTISDPKGHGAVYAQLDPALERYRALSQEEQLDFKDSLDKFVRTYSFLSQIVSFQNTSLERDYIYCRALAAYIRNAATLVRLDLGSEVELTHLRTEMTYEGSLSLVARQGEAKGIVAEARGKQYEAELEPLSKIVEVLNERFGLELGEADQLLFDQFEESWAADPDLVNQARNNTLENFRLVFSPKFINTIVTRMDANEAIFKQILDDAEFQAVLADFYVRKVYARLRAAKAVE